MSNSTGWHKKSESDAEALPGVEGGGPIFLIIKPDGIGKSNICSVVVAGFRTSNSILALYGSVCCTVIYSHANIKMRVRNNKHLLYLSFQTMS